MNWDLSNHLIVFTMEKLRKEFIKERKAMAELMKTVVTERHKKVVESLPPTTNTTKMTIDPQKLEDTIKKACVPIVKKSIQILDKLPAKPDSSGPVAVKKPAVLCKALNLNGTPCKCRAKIGKFCAKHAL